MHASWHPPSTLQCNIAFIQELELLSFEAVQPRTCASDEDHDNLSNLDSKHHDHSNVGQDTSWYPGVITLTTGTTGELTTSRCTTNHVVCLDLMIAMTPAAASTDATCCWKLRMFWY